MLTRRTQLRRSSPLSPISKKQRAKLRTYAKARCEVLAANPRCEFPGCTERAIETHHRKSRAQGGDHSVGNLIALCGVHHAWVHNHPAEAALRGFSVTGKEHIQI